jgi:Zn-dependent protease with chaperone function
MTLSYSWRLLCLSAAVFFLVNMAAGSAIALAAPLAVRLASRMSPRRAAHLLLAIRLLPPALAAVLVGALCIPSYLWLEPGSSAEYVGTSCLVLAILGSVVSFSALARASRAAVISRRVLRRPSPCLALAGILRPRLIVSPAVRDVLTPDQLEAALEHERAHWHSRDNLKRLLLLLSPGLLPFCSGFAYLERAWSRFTEWAADDRAVSDNPARSLALAAALVNVARLQAHVPAAPLATSLLGETPDLAARIHRLLHPAPVSERQRSHTAVTFVLAFVFLAILIQPSTLAAAHRVLERLME